MKGLKPRQAWHGCELLDYSPQTPPSNQLSSTRCASFCDVLLSARRQLLTAPHDKKTQSICVPQTQARCRSTFLEKKIRKYERRQATAVESGATMQEACNVRKVRSIRSGYWASRTSIKCTTPSTKKSRRSSCQIHKNEKHGLYHLLTWSSNRNFG